MDRVWQGLHNKPMKMYKCPSESREPFFNTHSVTDGAAATSYLAVEGLRSGDNGDGVIWGDLYGATDQDNTELSEITDGVSNTIMIGERPPTRDFRFGAWAIYFSYMSTLGTQEDIAPIAYMPLVTSAGYAGADPPGPNDYNCAEKAPWMYQPGNLQDYCHMFHFWSWHPGGGNWLFADGSVRTLGYEASPVTPALRTKSGGEVVSPDKY